MQKLPASKDFSLSNMNLFEGISPDNPAVSPVSVEVSPAVRLRAERLTVKQKKGKKGQR